MLQEITTVNSKTVTDIFSQMLKLTLVNYSELILAFLTKANMLKAAVGVGGSP